MLWLHDALNAAVLGVGNRLAVLDDITLPGWLDRRTGWSKRRDLRRFRTAERSEQLPPRGKDAKTDW